MIAGNFFGMQESKINESKFERVKIQGKANHLGKNM